MTAGTEVPLEAAVEEVVVEVEDYSISESTPDNKPWGSQVGKAAAVEPEAEQVVQQVEQVVA